MFDSTKEYDRWIELCTLRNLGAIRDLRRQVKFRLIPSLTNGKEKYKPCDYIADFVYVQDGETVVEDVKGYRKGAAYQLFMLKAKLMAQRYGIWVRQI